MMLTTVILVVLVMDTSLQFRSRTLAEPVAQQYGKPLCTDEMFSLIGCKTVDLYIDGIVQFFDQPNSGKCKNADKKLLNGAARVIAVKITAPDNEPGRFLASGKFFVTDGSWKCTNNHYRGWTGANINDTDWPHATVIGRHGTTPWGYIAGISSDAKWIWTANDGYGRKGDAVVYCRKSRDYCKCIGTGQSCISSCPPKYDGQYQSCKGCNVFATCQYGQFSDEQSCKVDGLNWDDNLKKCSNETSTTCKCCSDDNAPTTAAITTHPTSKTKTTVTTRPTTLTTLIKTTAQTTNRKMTTMCIITPKCITSCYGRTDGPYQSCKGCHVYAICYRGMMHDNLACSPDGTVWDDVIKKCDEHSSTCKPCQNEVTTTISAVTTQEATTVCNSGLPCITSCTDQVDGRYKSCKGCRFYAICSYGQLMDELPCGTDELELYWDDEQKECTSDSAACRSCTNEETTTAAVCTSGPLCITSCAGIEDGEYQLCKSCRVYAVCSYGQLMDELPCGTDEQKLYWDDERKECTTYSNTCHSCTNEETTTVAVTDEQTTTTSACPTERPYSSPCCKQDADRPCSNKWFFQFICKIMSEM